MYARHISKIQWTYVNFKYNKREGGGQKQLQFSAFSFWYAAPYAVYTFITILHEVIEEVLLFNTTPHTYTQLSKTNSQISNIIITILYRINMHSVPYIS